MCWKTCGTASENKDLSANKSFTNYKKVPGSGPLCNLMQLLKQVTRIFFQDCSDLRNIMCGLQFSKIMNLATTNNPHTSWPTSVIQTAIFQGLLIVFFVRFCPKNESKLKTANLQIAPSTVQILCYLRGRNLNLFFHSLSFNLFH